MGWGVETRRFQASERFTKPSPSTTESKIERSQTIKRYRFKSQDSKGFQQEEYLQWNNEENVLLQTETWKICC